MASKTLFATTRGSQLPRTDDLNEELAPAYRLSHEAMLAQYVATGCLNATFYASADEQLAVVLELCKQIDPAFIAKTAVFCRERGQMKDMPALLCAVLAVQGPGLLKRVFHRVIDNGKMLRNFVQIVRSGATGRKSLGSLPKRLVREWFERREDDAIFRASIGQSPSFGDILRMVHPTPSSPSREALFGYLLGRDADADALPGLVRQYEAYKAGESRDVPDVPFQMLTSLDLDRDAWTAIARNASWQTVRMNLNTFARHGVFEDDACVREIANRLRDPVQVAKARVLPYQLMAAYANTGADVPPVVRAALQDAMELSLRHTPRFRGKVFVFPDISGSMHSPITGQRKGSTTAVRCVDVAALVAAAIVRRNPDAEVIPFESRAIEITINPRDSVMTNATRLAGLPCGGTNCSAPLALLNKRRATGDLVVYVSDNESWLDAPGYGRFGGSATATLREWQAFKQRSPNARMVCIDIQPYGTTQAQEREDILNIGGFSDAVFEVLAMFANGKLDAQHWVGVIREIEV